MENFNHHHIFYAKREYRKNLLLYRLRQTPGLIIPIFMPDHRDLHRKLYDSVPKPNLDSVEYFLSDVLTPYESGQSRTRTLDQAIGWFALSGNEDTAEHLRKQREFILRTPPREIYEQVA